MDPDLKSQLLEAAGKRKNELPSSNVYRQIGFEGEKARLGWLIPPAWNNIEENLKAFLRIAQDKENFIFVGMGGSINTVKALIGIAAAVSKKNILTFDQLDPAALKEILSQVSSLDTTLVISISKSATTAETQVLSNTLKEAFQNKGLQYQDHYLWLIDEGGLSKLAERGWENMPVLPIQVDRKSDIGGRFTAVHTLVFFLPLILLVDKIDLIQSYYKEYLSHIDSLRNAAIIEAGRFFEKKVEYFGVQVKKELQGPLFTWVAQLIQESLGSKQEGFNPKTLVIAEDKELPVFFTRLNVPVAEDNVLAMMQAAYFLEVFVAALAYYYGINFVTQDAVEIYKRKMRDIKDAGGEFIEAAGVSLKGLLGKIEGSLKPKDKFVEVVVYAYKPIKALNALRDNLQNALAQKVLVFIGSDWNHHSYQAAANNQDTLFVILTQKDFISNIEGVSQATLSGNIKDHRIITYATYETLKNRALYLALEEL